MLGKFSLGDVRWTQKMSEYNAYTIETGDYYLLKNYTVLVCYLKNISQ